MGDQQDATRSRTEIVDGLLRGAVDLHCHSGPSIMERKLDHMEEIRDAEAAGLHAVLFKDHFYSNTPVMQVLQRFRRAMPTSPFSPACRSTTNSAG